MIGHYQKMIRKLINYRNIYKYLESEGFNKDYLQYLHDDIFDLDSKLKEIDKSISKSNINCLSGNYPGIFEQFKIKLFRKFRRCL